MGDIDFLCPNVPGSPDSSPIRGEKEKGRGYQMTLKSFKLQHTYPICYFYIRIREISFACLGCVPLPFPR